MLPGLVNCLESWALIVSSLGLSSNTGKGGWRMPGFSVNR